MSSLTVELTADQQAFLESRRSAKGFATAGEYLIDLIRREQIEVDEDAIQSGNKFETRMSELKSENPEGYEQAMVRIREAVKAGIASGPPVKMTEQEWDGLWLTADRPAPRDQAVIHG